MTSERASWAWRGCGFSSRELVSHGRVFFGRGGQGSDCGWLLRGEQTVGTKVEAGRVDIQVREESGLNWGARGGGGEK